MQFFCRMKKNHKKSALNAWIGHICALSYIWANLKSPQRNVSLSEIYLYILSRYFTSIRYVNI